MKIEHGIAEQRKESSDLNNWKSIPLCAKPTKGVFCAPNKFLYLCKHLINQNMLPVMEDNSYFLFVRDGRGQLVINGVEFDIYKGCVCWIQGTQVVTVRPDVKFGLELWSITYDYALINYHMFMSSPLATRMSIVTQSPILYPSDCSMNKFQQIFEDFNNINMRYDNGTAMIKTSLLGRLSLLFAMSLSNREIPDVEEFPLGWQASIYIAVHSRDGCPIKKAASELNTDPITLNSQLRITTSLNYDQTVSRNRCLTAMSYLLCENLPLDYIASVSGFDSDVTFYRSFKKIVGVTPSEYRDVNLCAGGKEGVYRGLITDDRLLSVVDYLYKNIGEEVNLEKIAKDTFLSPNIIRSLLRKAYGVGFKRLLQMLRTRYSEMLLASSEMNLIDVAVVAGFNSVSSFSRVFKEINGQLPSDYRKECRKRSN